MSTNFLSIRTASLHVSEPNKLIIPYTSRNKGLISCAIENELGMFVKAEELSNYITIDDKNFIVITPNRFRIRNILRLQSIIAIINVFDGSIMCEENIQMKRFNDAIAVRYRGRRMKTMLSGVLSVIRNNKKLNDFCKCLDVMRIDELKESFIRYLEYEAPLYGNDEFLLIVSIPTIEGYNETASILDYLQASISAVI